MTVNNLQRQEYSKDLFRNSELLISSCSYDSQATRYIYVGKEQYYFALCPRTIITVPLPLHTLYSVGLDHVSGHTRPSPCLTHTRVNLNNNNFARGGEGLGTRLHFIQRMMAKIHVFFKINTIRNVC